jgi:mannitol/fructose-specific phosphotransferase system IIA component (Ntr-type)
MTRSEQLGKLALLEGLGHEINLVCREGRGYIRATEEIRGKQRPPMISVASYRLKRGIPDDDLAVIESSDRRTPAARMLSIAQLFREPLVNLELRARTRDGVLAELAQRVTAVSPDADPDRVSEQLKRRERQMSTAVGHGIAIPHAITAEVEEPVLLLGRSRRGVAFASSLFHKPVRLLFVILAPEAERAQYLEILSSLARLLKQRKVGESLLRVRTAAEAVAVLRKYETLVRLQAELGAGGRA